MKRLAQNTDVSVTRRLDVLIFLHLDQKYPSMAEKIEKLAASGLTSGEMGQIVGKPTNYVAATIF